MIVAGFGFRASARVESLAEACRKAKSACGTSVSVTRLAVPEDKARTEVFAAFAARAGLDVTAVDPATLIAQKTQTRSAASFAARGSGSVAEAAALAAAGEGARLLGARAVSDDGLATCALAEGNAP